MITRNDIIDALTKSTGYDSAHTPQPSAIVIDAWVEHFEDFPALTRADLLMAVKDYHRQTHRENLQPADISTLARKYSRERFERSALDSPERIGHETLCDRKAADDPNVPALEQAATTRRTKIEAYAGMFGLTGRQAEARMAARATDDDLAYRRQLVDQARTSGPPQPMPDEPERTPDDRPTTPDA